MNQQQFTSLNANVKAFCKPLNDEQLIDLTDFLNYRCYDKEEPTGFIKDFIEEFFSLRLWDENLYDEIEKPAFFNKASMTDKELIRLVRVGLLQECFFRSYVNLKVKKTLVDTTNEPKPFVSREEGAKLRADKPKGPKEEKLSTQDKKDLKDILTEHHAMLKYQLEDEDGVREAGGNELVEEKKRHQKFINKFFKLKLF